MIATIHQPQYIPWLGYFDKMIAADVFIILDDVQYKKNDWQNRNRIRTSQGPQWLTLPVSFSHGEHINEVQINEKQKWRKSHWSGITMNYKKAPYLDKYADGLQELYQRDYASLADLNWQFINFIVDAIGIKTKLVRSSEIYVKSSSTQRLIDLCRAVEADSYIAGADGKNYMDVDLFKSSGIQLITQEYVHPTYLQCWMKHESDFISHLSILDLLLNCGEESLSILQQQMTYI